MSESTSWLLRQLVDDLNNEQLLINPTAPQATSSWRRRKPVITPRGSE